MLGFLGFMLVLFGAFALSPALGFIVIGLIAIMCWAES